MISVPYSYVRPECNKCALVCANAPDICQLDHKNGIVHACAFQYVFTHYLDLQSMATRLAVSQHPSHNISGSLISLQRLKHFHIAVGPLVKDL